MRQRRDWVWLNLFPWSPSTWTVAMFLLSCSIPSRQSLDQDQTLDLDQTRQALDHQTLQEAAAGVGIHAKLLQTAMVMLTVGLVKSSAPEVVLVCGVRRSLFEGWASGSEGLLIE
jgi:enamine deaminase RidA (YjgF/YER057c/UK114 family)